ncbi:C6 transcription factor [Metarhizium acridum CQMa 102]|uniref:C6 transcription factor n=1 Tax=Metarhizium acridum (strain CQMa 102) TaxID=655827 RepID=E9E5R4_METAQ|nr:C6 transcription factor [Metarhizium acridum CQMa 102]EFY88777.1 C6 transcription factor [Metarhizium acridum CQMa 102]
MGIAQAKRTISGSSIWSATFEDVQVNGGRENAENAGIPSFSLLQHLGPLHAVPFLPAPPTATWAEVRSSLPEPGDAVPLALWRDVQGPQPNGRGQSAQAFAQETNDPPQTISSRGMIHFKGRAASTRFYGFSYHLNLYQQVKAQYPLINRLCDDIFFKASRKPASGHSNQTQVDTQSLVNLVPRKEVVDALVQTYLDHVEVTHRVLYIPSLYRQYNRHWETAEETSENFLVQLCLIMAIASATRHEAATLVASPEPIEMAKKWIQAAESWLNSQHPTSVESLPSLQVQCLLLVAKRANYIHETTLWASTGASVRWAMAAGYHREVGSEAPISPFYREMRRRLWATITELDLLAAMERGMPPSIRQDEFNTQAPVNEDALNIISSIPELVGPFTSPVEHAWRIVEKRVTLTLEGVSDYYVLSMIIGLVKSLYIPTSSATWAKDVSEKVIFNYSDVSPNMAYLRSSETSGGILTAHSTYASEANSGAARDHDADFFHTLTPDDMDFLLNDINFGSFLEDPDTEASHLPLFSWNA